MKVVIAAATKMEWQQIHDTIDPKSLIENNHIEVEFITTGIGVMATTYALTNLIFKSKPDLIIQVGIAGSYIEDLQLAEVVVVDEDCQGDLVVEESGQLLDLFDLNLNDENMVPFLNKKLPNPWLKDFVISLKKVPAITISEVTTSANRSIQLQQKYNGKIETMEGAALHYVCLQNQVPFIQVKAISNYVGERNKSNWVIKDALSNLSSAVVDILLSLKITL